MPLGSCSVYNEFTDSSILIDPVSIKIEGIQHGVLCDFTIAMSFRHHFIFPVEGSIYIPVENNMCIHSISIHKENEIIKLQVMPTKSAKEFYNASVESGEQAFIVNNPENRVCTLKMGNFPPDSECVVVYKITTTAISSHDDSFLLKFPLESINPSGKIAQINADHFLFKLKTEQFFKIKEISSNIKEGTSFVKESDYKGTYEANFHRKIPNKDSKGNPINSEKCDYLKSFILTTKFESKLESFVCRYGSYCTISAFPQIASNKLTPSLIEQEKEYVFVIDCSGSMTGGSIENAKQCLSLFIHSLPVKSLFNVVRFGSTFEKIFANSVPYTENNAKKALDEISEFKANLGGTEMSNPLQFIFEQRLKIPKQKRQVFVITDGQDFNPDRVLELVNAHKNENRCFSIGIGHGADPGIVRGIAEISGGTCDFVYEGVDIATKVIPQLSASKSAVVTNIEFFIEGKNDLIIYPSVSSCPGLIPNLLSTFICKLNKVSDKIDHVLMSGEISEGSSAEFLFQKFSDCQDQEVTNACEKMYQFFEMNEMQSNVDLISTKIDKIEALNSELDEDEQIDDTVYQRGRKAIEASITSLSCKSGILSNYTSFVGRSEVKESISDFNRIFVKINNKEYIKCEIPKNCPNVKELLSAQIEEKTQMAARKQSLKTLDLSNNNVEIDFNALKDCSKVVLIYHPIRDIEINASVEGKDFKILIDSMDNLSTVRNLLKESLGKTSTKIPICLSDGAKQIYSYTDRVLDNLDITKKLSFVKRYDKDGKEIEEVSGMVYVKTLTGRCCEIPIEFSPDVTILDLKKMITKKEGIPVDQQRVIFAGKQLEDDIQMNCYNPGCTFHLVLRLRGGGCPLYISRIDAFEGYSKVLLNNLLCFHSIDGSFSQLSKIQEIVWKTQLDKTQEITTFLFEFLSKLGLEKAEKVKQDRVLATLLALALLRKDILDQIELWQLIEDKALEWLAGSNPKVNWANVISDIMSKI